MTLSLEASSYVLGLQESVSAVADVTGTETPVTWTLDCETGQASIAPSGNSALLTALGSGTCFLWATEGQLTGVAIVRIPPLAVGDPCTDESQCGPAAPKCGSTSPSCGTTCTLACTTDTDCPISDAFGHHASCTKQLCQLIRDPDYSCA